MSLPTAHLRPLIQGAAFAANLPWWRAYAPAEWLEAIVLQESGGNPKARRYEPAPDRAGRTDAASDADVPDRDDGLLEDDESFGLMQVMGTNIRRIVGAPPGTPLNFGFALRPLMAMALGCRILADELDAAGDKVDLALARYNGGSVGNPRSDGSLRNQSYVDGVAAFAAKVHSDRKGTI